METQIQPHTTTQSFLIRPIRTSDSLDELTELLHAAYKPLGEMGLRFFATHQTVEQTRDRVESGECFVAELDGEVVGTITLYTEPYDSSPDWYRREDVGWFGQFAVEPSLQRKGIGRKMIEFIESRARERGLMEIALDTSEKASHLIAYYQKMGWRVVDETQWEVTNYRSLILSKSLS